MDKKHKHRASERGSATLLEMCFIFPIVLVVVCAMLYYGLYFLQGAALTMYAQKAAVEVSRMISMAGYDEFGTITSATDFDFESGVPDSEAVKDVVSEHNPYRFWSGTNVVDSDDKTAIENATEQLLKASSFLGATSTDCVIDINNYFITQSVKATVTQTFDAPFFFTFFGMNDDLNMTITVQAAATCPAEFVRNIDLVYDMVDYLLTKFKIGSLDSFVSKLTEYKTKYGL